MKKTKTSRRQFLKSSSLTGMAGYLAYSTSGPGALPRAVAQQRRSPNDEPGIGFIGTGIRFHSYLGKHGMKHGPCIGVCDVDSVQAGRALQVAMNVHREKKRPIMMGAHEDYRHLLDNQDVDVVVIATVDHWHSKIAIEAMQAGKDVYCEKPVTLTIREGQQILEAQAKTGRVLQVGTQQRTEFNKRFATAAAMVRDDRVGDLQETTICIGGSRECDALPLAQVPRHLNWEMWQGQCPEKPYRSAGEVVDVNGWGAGHPFSRTHRYFRWFYEYSGGKLTDWGAHHVDIALWALDKHGQDVGQIVIEPMEVEHPVALDDQGMPQSDDRFNCATRFKVKCTFDDGTVFWIRDTAPDKGFENGIMFTGKDKRRFLVNRGKLVGRPVEDLAQKPLPADALAELYVDDPTSLEGYGSDGFHMKNFFDCVQTRKQPASDMESHHRMLNLCHAVNVAMRLNRKVVFDTKTETFGNDEMANSFIEREQRPGYEIKV